MAGTMAVVGVLFLVVVCNALDQGPCPKTPLFLVDVDEATWAGDVYCFIERNNPGAQCQWASRRLGFKNGGITLETLFKNLQNGEEDNIEVEATKVEPGHYAFVKEIDPTLNATFHVYFLCYEPKKYDCILICSDDLFYANGFPAIYISSQYPDPVKEYAPKIKEVLELNQIYTENLMVVDNCNCPNIPYLRGPSSCNPGTVEEYFS